MSSSAESSKSSQSSQSSDDGLNKTANCIRKVSNFSYMKDTFKMDNDAFNPEYLNMIMAEASPKLEALFDKIQKLDAQDMKKTGKLYKHFIYSDAIAPAYGVKLIASAFIAKGFKCCFNKNLNIINDEKLLETKNNNFGVLVSKKIHDKMMTQKHRKAMTDKYNSRPDNINGDLMRFIILDSGFREGLDLFDVKYVHLFEQLLVNADEKQAIGRATRFCGQKGLNFNPTLGWPLYIFRYDINFDKEIQNTNSMFELFLKYSNIDVKKIIFASELEGIVIDAAIDKNLTKEIHTFKIENVPPIFSPKKGGSGLPDEFDKFKYGHVKLENKCADTAELSFTPTQDLIRHYFTPKTDIKGMLLFHGIGTGKTCTAIATATTSFDKEDYTILWVTRHTLKSDIWKNMFKQICHMKFIEEKRKFPNKITAPMKYLSDNWIEPLSYKQFSNMLLKLNKFYDKIINRNGEDDPLHKTLLIIDEAHKLYTNIGNIAERPNMNILEKMIDNSYKKSGKDSVRVLLMTATPYTEDSMEMIKLLNLLREEKLPKQFDSFSKKYLNNDGYFTEPGKKEFKTDIKGYVSYINRSQDARYFAHPIIEPVYVPITYNANKIPTKEYVNKLKDVKTEQKLKRTFIADEQKKCKVILKEIKKNCVEDYKDELDTLKNAKAECKTKECKTKATEKLDAYKETKSQTIDDCMSKGKEEQCENLTEHEEEYKRLEEERIRIIEYITNITKENSEINNEMKEISLEIKNIRIEKAEIMKEKKENKRDKVKVKELNKKLKELYNEYTTLKADKLNLKNKKHLNRVKLGNATLPDFSVYKVLNNKCLGNAPKKETTPKKDSIKALSPQIPTNVLKKIVYFYLNKYDKVEKHNRVFILLTYHPDKLPKTYRDSEYKNKLEMLYSRIFSKLNEIKGELSRETLGSIIKENISKLCDVIVKIPSIKNVGNASP